VEWIQPQDVIDVWELAVKNPSVPREADEPTGARPGSWARRNAGQPNREEKP